MIILFAGNAMSEALYLFTLIATARYTMRWLRDRDLRSLVYGGSALGLAYLARNEAAASAIVTLGLVFAASITHEVGPRRKRIVTALSDSIIFIFPFGACFVGWAMASLVITGQAFGQLQSQYGVAQVQAAGQGRNTHAQAIHWLSQVLLHMAPVLPLVAIVALVVAWRRRDWLMLAPIATLGAALGFDLLSYYNNQLITSYRYMITSIPLLVMLVGGILTSRRRRSDGTLGVGAVDDQTLGGSPVVGSRHKIPVSLTSVAAAMLALAVIGPTLITTGSGMMSPYVSGHEESVWLGFVFHKHWNGDDVQEAHHYATVLSMSAYLGGLKLKNGNVLVDNFSSCVPEIIATIADPKVFVIPNDRDFQRILAAPLTFNTHFILEEDPIGAGALTAVSTAYPDLWKSGGGFATAIRTINPKGSGDCPVFRLFRVDKNPSSVTQ
jgi:hypothetical protein